MLVKLCTSSFAKLCASKILSTYYPRNDIYLKIRASEIRTSEIRASQGPPVLFSATGPIFSMRLAILIEVEMFCLRKI